MDKLENLKKLKVLFDDGVISEKEYAEMKNEIIGNTIKPQVESIEIKVNESKEEIKPKSILEQITEKSTLVDDVHLIEDESLIKSLKFLGEIYGWSGWGGLLENLGVKNAESKLIKKAAELGANVILITGSSTNWGVKINGKAYKI
jgi:hypothetical protein